MKISFSQDCTSKYHIQPSPSCTHITNSPINYLPTNKGSIISLLIKHHQASALFPVTIALLMICLQQLIVCCPFADAITKSTPFFIFSGVVLLISYILFILATCSNHHTIQYFISGVLFIISGEWKFSFFFKLN